MAINLNNLLLRNSTNENIIVDQNLKKTLMESAEKKSATGSTSSIRKTSMESRNDSTDKPNMIYFKQLLKKLNIVSHGFEIPKKENITDSENINKNNENLVTEENLDVSHFN